MLSNRLSIAKLKEMYSADNWKIFITSVCTCRKLTGKCERKANFTKFTNCKACWRFKFTRLSMLVFARWKHSILGRLTGVSAKSYNLYKYQWSPKPVKRELYITNSTSKKKIVGSRSIHVKGKKEYKDNLIETRKCVSLELSASQYQ